jgi:hypothetical protein
MAPAHESETIVFNFRKLLSTLPKYAELEQILLFSVNWGKQVCDRELDLGFWEILKPLKWTNITSFFLIWLKRSTKIFISL